jgi:hypothetical protein
MSSSSTQPRRTGWLLRSVTTKGRRFVTFRKKLLPATSFFSVENKVASYALWLRKRNNLGRVGKSKVFS